MIAAAGEIRRWPTSCRGTLSPEADHVRPSSCLGRSGFDRESAIAKGEHIVTALTRRAFVAGVSVAPFAAPTASHAAMPPSGKQAPGFYRYKVGEFECTSVNDGARTYPVFDGFVRNVSKDQVIAAAEAAYFPKGMVTVPFNPQLINTGSKLVLIDAGIGPGFGPTLGRLTANLAAAGVDPKAVDIVVLSHLHVDHASGIRAADGSLAFPNAEIKLPALDWAFWMSDANMAKAQDDAVLKGFFAAARKAFAGIESKVTHYTWGQEVAPGITAVDTGGHTPGHTSFAVASGNARVLIQSDITNVPQLFMRNPDWQISYDIDPQKSQANRHRFYDMAAAEKAMVVGYHFPFPAAGYVEKDGNGYRLVPVVWQPVL
jgi:glyoxylase-like metal-dependent hydrolase (beta-lactamase superfamily II)